MSTSRVEDWELRGAEGETIFGTAHLPDEVPRGVLLICHGFKGYKDYGFLPMLADRASKAGFVAHRFNFSHGGMTRNVETFERPDLFERDTWNKQVFDLLAVSAAAQRGELAGHAANVPGAGLPGVWFGHSRGGVTCLLAAGRLIAAGDEAQLPGGIVSAGSPHVCCSLSDDDRQKLLTEGRLRSPSGRTGQDLWVGRAWLAEQLADPAAHDPYRAAGMYGGPRLVVHGTADATVPEAAAVAYADAVGGRGELSLIEGASHVFDASNPLALDAEPPAATSRLIEATLAFAAKVCRDASRPGDDAQVK